MKEDRHEIGRSGAMFHAIDLGGQRGFFHRHVLRALVKAGSLLFVVHELTCSLR